VLDGVDAAYTAQPSGVKETLTLADASAPSTYRFALAASSGLVPALRDDGSVVFRGPQGAIRFWLPAPTVQAAGQAVASTQHVAYHLSDDGQSLSVVVDPAWLASASFPVKVDPTIYDGASVTACTLGSGSLAAGSDCSSGLLQIGYDGSHVLRTALRFDGLAEDGIPTGAAIDYAQLGLTSEGMDHVEVHPQIDVAGLGHTLGSGATWTNYDSTHAWTTPGGDTNATPDVRPLVWGSFFDGHVSEPWGWDVSGLVQSWLRDPSTNHGLLLQAHDETAVNVMSVDSPTGANQGPYLQIDWRWRPGIERDQSYQSVGIDDQSALNVNVVSGNLSVRSGDVHLPGVAGMDLDFSRTYNSGDLADDHLTGSAWSPEVNGAGLDLENHFLSDGHTLYANGGAIYRFDRDPSADSGTTLAFTTPSGIDATMTQDNITAVTTVTFDDGMAWTYTDGNFYSQQLTQIADGDGHHIDLSYDGDQGDDGRALGTITDTNGDVLTVTRDEDGNVTGLTDADDRHWAYAKNTSVNNRLDSITDPDANTTGYHYRADIPTVWDLLDNITDRDGHDIKLQYSADGNPFHLTKITRELDATPAHNLVWRFNYAPATGVGDACTATGVLGRTVETDPDGQQITYCYDTNGQVVQTFGDPTNTAPSNTTAPAVTGTTTDGHTLTADDGTWTGTAPITYTRQWQRCDATGGDCTNITGQTSTTHTLDTADVGSTLRVVVTATNSTGTATETSAATAVVAADAPVNTTLPTISGTATAGHTLTATDGTWTGTAPITYTHQWRRCDTAGDNCTNITSAAGSTYDLTSGDAGATIRVVITATNAAGPSTATSAKTALIAPGALVNTTPPAISGTTTDGHTLTATNGTWTGTAPITYARQWRRCDTAGDNCTNITDATGSTYTLTAADVGSTIRVVVTATDASGSVSATSDVSAPIAATAPANTAFPLISGTATGGHTLSSTTGTWSGTAPFTFTRQWRRCDSSDGTCTDIAGATDNDYTLTPDDIGSTITVVITATNAVGSVSATSAATAPITAAAPDNDTPPSISGITTDGRTLTATNGTWSGTAPISYTYQWRRCGAAGDDCEDIDGVTGASHTLTHADVGATIRVVVTATNAASSETATTDASAVVGAAIPSSTALPVISGTTTDGETLSSATGSWSGTPPMTYVYQWRRCDATTGACEDIDDATHEDYALTSGDVGARIAVVVTATNDAGSASATSAATAAVASAAPRNTLAPSVSGSALTGAELTADDGEWASGRPIDLSRRWQRCDADGEDCVDIDDATGSTYSVTYVDVGHRLRVVVRAHNALESTEATTEPTDVVAIALPSNTAPPSVSGDAIDRSTLTTTGGEWDGLAPIDVTLQWQRCDADGEECTDIDGATAPSYDVTTFDVGGTLRAVATAANAGGYTTEASAVTNIVQALAPFNVTAPRLVGVAQATGHLSVRPGDWDGTPDISYGYSWSLCGPDGGGCHTVDDQDEPRLDVTAGMNGMTVRATVTATNAAGGVDATTAQSKVVGLFSATVKGVARVDETLSAQPDELLGTAPATFTYRWQRCDADGTGCADVEGAENDAHTLSADDRGHTVRVIVDGDAGDVQKTATSPATAVVAALVPINKALPVIIGRTAVGSAVRADDGDWDSDGAPTYQWLRCSAEGTDCLMLDGATDSQYDVQAEDAGSTLVASVTETSTGGSATAASVPSELIEAPALMNTALPTVTRQPGASGDVLHAGPGDWEADDPITYTYQWMRCGEDGDDCVRLDGAEEQDVSLTSEDVGASLRVLVVAHTPGATETARSEATDAITTGALSAGDAPVLSGTAAVGELLSADGDTWNGVGPFDVTYRWQRCDAAGDGCIGIRSATDPLYLATDDDADHTLRVVATATDGTHHATSTSETTAVVTAASPVFSGPQADPGPSISGVASPGGTLTVSPGTWSGMGLVDFTYQWARCTAGGTACEDLAGATSATYVPGAGDVGHALQARIVATDTLGSSAAVATTGTSVRAADGPELETAPTLSGTAREDEVLVATTGTWVAGTALTFTTTWQFCAADDDATCSDLDDEEDAGASYTVGPDDVDGHLRAVVTAADADGATTTAVSAISDTVAAAAPRNTELPDVSGDAEISGTLTAAPGTWQGVAPITYVYQWQRCDLAGAACADLPDADASTYTIDQDDAGSTLRVVVTATNASGTSRETSAPTGAVGTGDGPVNTVAPTFIGSAAEGAVLGVDHGTWTGAGAITYTYEWLRCDSDGGQCAVIDGASADELTLSADDVYGSVRIAVTAGDDEGSTTVVSDASDEVASNAEAADPAVVNLRRPSLSGDVQQDQLLATDDGTWDATGVLDFRYGWRLCDADDAARCTLIDGADSATIVPDVTMVGQRLRSMVTAVLGKETVTVQSAPSAVVVHGAPYAATLPTITGDAVDGSELSSDLGEWLGGDDPARALQWQRCDAAGAACADLPGETGTTYALTADDVEHTVRTLVTATNAVGTTHAASLPTSVVASRLPSVNYAPSLMGVARQDGTLTVDPGVWDGTPDIALADQWERCNADGDDCAPIDGATGEIYILTADDRESRIRVLVTATNAAGEAFAETDPTDVVEAASVPVLVDGYEPLVYGDAHDGQILSADPGLWDGAQPLTFSYAWQRCDDQGEDCSAITDATSDTYTLTGADLGATVRLAVAAHNATGDASATSAATDVVATGVPSNIGEPYVDGTFAPGGELIADPGVWGGTAPMSYVYAWMRCADDGSDCEAIVGADADHYTVAPGDARHALVVAVTATNGHGSETATSYPVVIEAPRPTNLTVPTIDGSVAPRTDTALTASPGTWDSEPDAYAYQWQRCHYDGSACVDIAGSPATEQTYTPGEPDAAKRLRVVVSAQNDGDSSPPTATSETTQPVVGATPHNAIEPTVSTDEPQLGYAVTVDPGTWVADGPPAFLYQWQRCQGDSCTDIDGATSAAYTPGYDDIAYGLRAGVSATDRSSGAWVRTVTIEAVPDGAVANLVVPSADGNAVVGDFVFTDEGGWTSNLLSTDTSTWQRCDAAGANCTDIPGSAGRAYWVQRADVGHRLRAIVIGHGQNGDTPAISALTPIVAAATRPAFADGHQPTVTGTAAAGQWLGLDLPDTTGSPEIDQTQQWQRCDPDGGDCEDLDGETDSIYKVHRADGGWVVRATVTLTNGAGSVTYHTAPTETVPASPSIANLEAPSIPHFWWDGQPYVGESLELDVGIWAGNPDQFTVQWLRCDPDDLSCQAIPGATSVDGYDTTSEDQGYRIAARVTAHGDGDETVSVTTALMDDWVQAETTFFGVKTASAIAIGQPVTVDVDENYTSGIRNYDYAFMVSGATVQDGPSPTYVPVPGTAGTELSVTVTETVQRADGAFITGIRERVETLGRIGGALTNTSLPSIAGEPFVGVELNLDRGVWVGGGAGATMSYVYAWERCDEDGDGCVAVEDADHDSYTTTNADVGHRVTATVTAVVGGNVATGVAATATPTDVIGVATGPANADKPTISGTPAERETLTADAGTWTGSPAPQLTYQWQRCAPTPDLCVDIDDATKDTYVPTSDDLDAQLRAVVRGDDAAGSVEATSDPTEPIGPGAEPAVDDLPSVTLVGPSGPGSTLMTDGGRWTNADENDLSYQWQRCAADGSDCADITESDAPAYDLTGADTGHRLQIVVTATTDAGTARGVSDASNLIGGVQATAEASVAFVDEQQDAVEMQGVDGGAATTLATCTQIGVRAGDRCILEDPRISPSAKVIAFAAHTADDGDGEGSIYLVNVDGTGLKKLTDGTDPAWTPDGTQIAFTKATSDGTRAVVISADGVHADEPSVLTGDDASDDGETGPGLRAFGASGVKGDRDTQDQSGPDVSILGALTFVGTPRGGGSPSLYLADEVGQTAHRLTLPTRLQDISHPRFSFDGSAIVFNATADHDFGAPSIWQVGVDGSGVRRLSANDGHAYGPPSPGPDDVVSTRSVWEGCFNPTFTGLRAMAYDDSCPYADPGVAWLVLADTRLPIDRAFQIDRADKRFANRALIEKIRKANNEAIRAIKLYLQDASKSRFAKASAALAGFHTLIRMCTEHGTTSQCPGLTYSDYSVEAHYERVFEKRRTILEAANAGLKLLIAAAISALLGGGGDAQIPAPKKEAIEWFNQFVSRAAAADGASTDEEITEFATAHEEDVKDAVTVFGEKKMNENGALWVARGMRFQKLQNVLGQVYRFEAVEGDGSSIWKLRDEHSKLGCGIRCGHYKKVWERRNNLDNIRRDYRDKLSSNDLKLLDKLRGMLDDVLDDVGDKAPPPPPGS
jgi:hypothetical protein